MTTPTDTGTLYQADPFHTTPPVALPPAEPTALEKLDAKIRETEDALEAARVRALANDKDVQDLTGLVFSLGETRKQYVQAQRDIEIALSGNGTPAPKRGRRSKHAAVDGG